MYLAVLVLSLIVSVCDTACVIAICAFFLGAVKHADGIVRLEAASVL